MDDNGAGELLSIGAFARRVGLAPSALRFYDDCGALRPARVDPATGYRFYAAGQEPRAVLLRRLREAGLPLVDAAVVLDGRADEARRVLAAHLERTRKEADAARAVVEELLRELPGGSDLEAAVRAGGRVRARVGGAELASAVRQVAPAVATAAARAEFPVLGCVLLELDGQEIRLVATDRYRLAVRVLRPTEYAGGSCRVPVPVEELRGLAAWAVRSADVEIEAAEGGDGLRVYGQEGSRTLLPPPQGGDFPQYRLMLDGLEPAGHRVIADRAALRDAFADRADCPVVTLRTTEQGVEVAGGGRPGTGVLRALWTGPPLSIAFDPAVLVPALDAGVGPDVLLEIASAAQPVVVRSADQGSFTTLVMPVRDTTAA